MNLPDRILEHADSDAWILRATFYMACFAAGFIAGLLVCAALVVTT